MSENGGGGRTGLGQAGQCSAPCPIAVDTAQADVERAAGVMSEPDEVADVVAFLLSERASWISGTHICVDGAQGRPSAAAW